MGFSSPLVPFTCVAIAIAGLVVGPPCLSVCLSGRPSVTLYGFQVCVICNSKSFHSFSFKLCLMNVHILKMCTSYFMHVSIFFFSFLRGVELRDFFYPKC